MKNFIISLALLGGAALLPLHAATMASQPWTTNRIAEAEARVNARITSATNAIPAPGDYANVSNRAMSALQSHQPLTPATNYTDAALGAFAATGSVSRAFSYGTPTRWTDATGCVWKVVDYGGNWRVAYNSVGVEFVAIPVWREPPDETVPGWYAYGLETGYQLASTDYNATLTDIKRYSGGVYDDVSGEMVYYTGDVSWMRGVQTIFAGRVALTNDVPDVSGYTTPADVTAAIREQSIGGIWDRDLGVWWTPIMENGALRYTATTNVNLNAGN